MDFFGIGPGELLLIIIVALIVFGPERLADVGKTVGKTMHDFRKAASDLTTQVTREIDEVKAAAQPPAEEKSATMPPVDGKDATKPPGSGDSRVQP